VQRLQEWIHRPTIAAENVGAEEGVQLFIRMLRDAGFQRTERLPWAAEVPPRSTRLIATTEEEGEATGLRLSVLALMAAGN
jgi:hypothetical protein